jgi:hypothetical protein
MLFDHIQSAANIPTKYDRRQTSNPNSVVRAGAGAEVPLLMDTAKPVGRTIADLSISHQELDAG